MNRSCSLPLHSGISEWNQKLNPFEADALDRLEGVEQRCSGALASPSEKLGMTIKGMDEFNRMADHGVIVFNQARMLLARK